MLAVNSLPPPPPPPRHVVSNIPLFYGDEGSVKDMMTPDYYTPSGRRDSRNVRFASAPPELCECASILPPIENFTGPVRQPSNNEDGSLQ